jgi:ABC-type transport system involved in multi-copper enzyme maturation permease subunit
VNRGLVIRAFRELWSVTLLLALLLMAVEAAIAFVLARFGAEFANEWTHVKLARTIMEAMLGTKILEGIGPAMFQAVAWVHPVVFALSWAHAMVSCSRVPAGEVDRGTADVLLGLPVSRREVFLSETFVWLVCGAGLLAAALAGNMLGSAALAPDERPPLARLLPVLLNFFCLYWAVGGLTWFVSSLSNRRGRAMTVVFLILLLLFLLNYLAQFWKPLELFVFLSPLHYLRPVSIIGDGVWPWGDMTVLAITGGLFWIAGGIVFARRDLCTV